MQMVEYNYSIKYTNTKCSKKCTKSVPKVLQLLLFPLPYPHYPFPPTTPPLFQLLPIPSGRPLPKHSFLIYMLCMPIHNLTFSSQGLSPFPMDAISVPVLTQLFPIPELVLPGLCTAYPPYMN